MKCRSKSKIRKPIRRRARRNPGEVPLLEWHEPQIIVEAHPGTYQHDSPVYQEWNAKYEARAKELQAEMGRLEADDTTILKDVINGMVARYTEAKRAQAFESIGSAELARFAGATMRDAYAAIFIDFIIRSRLYVPGRIVHGIRKRGDFAEIQAQNEQIAALYENYFNALAAFESRPEVASGKAARDIGRSERFVAARKHFDDMGSYLTKAQGEAYNDRSHLAVKEVGKAIGQLRLAFKEIGWQEAHDLLSKVNITSLKGAVSRMKVRAAKGQAAMAPSLESLEEAAAEGDLTPEGAKLLRRARKKAETQQRHAVEKEASVRQAYEMTEEEVYFPTGGYSYTGGAPRAVRIMWRHPEANNPALTRKETLEVGLVQYGPRAGSMQVSYEAVTHGAPVGRSARPRRLKPIRASASSIPNAPNTSMGVPELSDYWYAPSSEPNPRERVALMYLRAMQLLAARQSGQPAPPARFY